MSDLNKSTIEILTELSKIRCTEEEKTSLLKDLQKILSYIDLLNEVDTDGIAPCNYVLQSNQAIKKDVNVMRDDVVETTMSRKDLLKNAPDQIGGMIRIPPIFNTKT